MLTGGLLVGVAVGDEIRDIPDDLVQGLTLAAIARALGIGGIGVLDVLNELGRLDGLVDADDVPGLAQQ